MLEIALFSLFSARNEGGEYDVMILATVQTYFLLMSWFVVMYVYFCV